MRQNVATKEHKRQVRGLIEALESRVHLGPPVRDTEIASAQEFLRQNDFAPNSHYFGRLTQIQHRITSRLVAPASSSGKRNYGGLAGDRWMQLLSVYDHVILSTCYEGDFATQSGKVKISHRFNRAGRIDFVELKFLRSLHSCLNGEIRTLVRLKDYQNLQREWWASEAFVLQVLPRELIFLHGDIFRFPRNEVLAWLVNIGHRMAGDLVTELGRSPAPNDKPHDSDNGEQLPLERTRHDEVAWPILERARSLECTVEPGDPKTVVIRYVCRNPG